MFLLSSIGYSQSNDSVTISLQNAAWLADRVQELDSCKAKYKEFGNTMLETVQIMQQGIELKEQQIQQQSEIIRNSDAQMSIMLQKEQSYKREIAAFETTNNSLQQAIKHQRNYWKAPTIGVGIGALAGCIVGYSVSKTSGAAIGTGIGVSLGVVSGTILSSILFR